MKRLITVNILLLLAVLAHSAPVSFAASTRPQANPTVQQEQLYTVQRVVDGDTLQLSNGEKVRLIGVDTSESADNPKLRRDAQKTGQDRSEIIQMGKAAAEFTRKLAGGKQVRLEYDVQQRDKYGRLLAYVYVVPEKPIYDFVHSLTKMERLTEMDLFLNAYLVEQGYAQVMTIPPNVKCQELFVKLEKEAREQRRGLWK
ncbi:MAG: thermonuclease family protein [Candidatus Omnitrophota bacterium]|jgi:micrococcal nuclease